MFRYVLALLLVVTYSNSLPTSNQANGSVALLLTSLSKECKNPFLSSQITARINECDVSAPPYNEKEFECLIFYDINSRLCKAASESNDFDLKEDFTTAISEEINVEQLCTNSKNWSFGIIKDFPGYQQTVTTVFTAKIACVKVCGVEDVTSQDANFFCKYYKWGFQVLNKLTTTAKSVVPTSNAVVATNVNVDNHEAVSETDQKKTSSVATEVKIPAVNNELSNNEQVIINNEPESSKTSSNTVLGTKISEGEKTDSIQTPASNKQVIDPNSALEVQDKSGDVEVKIHTDLPASASAPINLDTKNEGIDKPSAAGVDAPKKEDTEDKEDNFYKLENQKESTADKTKLDTSDDYQDAEDGKEGLPDAGDDGDDPMLGDLDTKHEIIQTKITKKIETPMSFPGEREYYPNAQDYSDDDDHFFPFFLTAVILVVLIYVLYHNKSKVSKVVLGLIVEGRQPGRRRNSRGHAYRRLDTLEQAMSTNSTAPPSKIIY